MPRRRLGRALAILFIVAAATPSARAASPGRDATDLLARLWGAFASVWTEAGCILDPNGACTAGSSNPPSTNVGCILDPHGGCAAEQSEPPAPPPSTDAGCIIDPNGGCAPGS